MPSHLFEVMDNIFQHKVDSVNEQNKKKPLDKQGPEFTAIQFLSEPTREGDRLRFFSDKTYTTPWELGPNGQKFIDEMSDLTSEQFKQSPFCPPYTKENVEKMYEAFDEMEKDLTDNPEWDEYWQAKEIDLKKIDPNINMEDLKQQFLNAYRFKIISNCPFPYKEPTLSPEANKARAQDFAQVISKQKRDTPNSEDAFESAKEDSHKKFDDKFGSTVNMFTTYIKNENRANIDNSFKEIMGDKSVAYLGEHVVMEKMLKNTTFATQVPDLIKLSPSFKSILERNIVFSAKNGNTEQLQALIKITPTTDYKRSFLDRVKDGFKGLVNERTFAYFNSNPPRTPSQIAKDIGGEESQIIRTQAQTLQGTHKKSDGLDTRLDKLHQRMKELEVLGKQEGSDNRQVQRDMTVLTSAANFLKQSPHDGEGFSKHLKQHLEGAKQDLHLEQGHSFDDRSALTQETEELLRDTEHHLKTETPKPKM